MLSPYRAQIQSLSSCNPTHVEAWMRSEHATLDHLSASDFAAEVRAAERMIADAGAAMSERLAASFGLQGIAS